MSDADVRVEDIFGHGELCHTRGCAGLGYCYTVAAEAQKRYGSTMAVPPDFENTCGKTDCDCITAAIQKVVRDERALVLEQAGEAIFGFSAKPQRGLRHLRRYASMVRSGEA